MNTAVHVLFGLNRKRTSNRPRLTEHATAERDVVDAGADLLIPARDNNTGRERVLVLIAQFLKDRCSDVDGWALAGLLPSSRL